MKMELTTLNVTLLGVLGSFIGIFISSFINWLIAKDNREKSLNEWRREKLLSLIYSFFEEFRKDTIYNNKNVTSFDTSIIKEIAFKNYSSSDRKAHQICLFLKDIDSINFLKKYRKLKEIKSEETENRFFTLHSGNHYDFYEEKNNDDEYADMIKMLSTILKKMK